MQNFFLSDYISLFILFLVSIGLALVILAVSYLFSVQKPYLEKASVYECGFDPYEDSRNQFEIRFYVIAILFIIFDLEALFLFPWCISLEKINLVGYWIGIDFLVELIIGFLYVWRIGGLVWE